MPRPINNFAVQLATAIKPVEPVFTQKGTTFLSDIQTDEFRAQAFLKLLKVEDIAREALCATLARMLGLPIKQAYYVFVDPSYIEGRLVGNSHHIAFGLERDRFFPTSRIQNLALGNLAAKWNEAIPCAVFDEWIFNNDRLPNNLIFDSSGVYWLIDHDEALPNFARPNMLANSTLLHEVSKSKSEIELWGIRDKTAQFVERISSIDWSEVLELLRPLDLPTSEGSYHRFIEFLQQRTPYLVDLVSTSIGIRQQRLNLNGEGRMAILSRNENDH